MTTPIRASVIARLALDIFYLHTKFDNSPSAVAYHHHRMLDISKPHRTLVSIVSSVCSYHYTISISIH